MANSKQNPVPSAEPEAGPVPGADPEQGIGHKLKNAAGNALKQAGSGLEELFKDAYREGKHGKGTVEKTSYDPAKLMELFNLLDEQFALFSHFTAGKAKDFADKVKNWCNKYKGKPDEQVEMDDDLDPDSKENEKSAKAFFDYAQKTIGTLVSKLDDSVSMEPMPGNDKQIKLDMSSVLPESGADAGAGAGSAGNEELLKKAAGAAVGAPVP